MPDLKLNVGCGEDYREGWVNLDACSLFKRDDSILLPDESLAKKFGRKSADIVVARDIIEHFFRWDGLRVLADFAEVLKFGGKLELMTPDLGKLITTALLPIGRKMELIRGAQGQAYGPGVEPEGLTGQAWRAYPDWFCHKYLWTEDELRTVLTGFGFKVGAPRWQGPECMTLISTKE